MLHHLKDADDEDADPPPLPERLAAKGLFCWEVSLHLLLLNAFIVTLLYIIPVGMAISTCCC